MYLENVSEKTGKVFTKPAATVQRELTQAKSKRIKGCQRPEEY